MHAIDNDEFLRYSLGAYHLVLYIYMVIVFNNLIISLVVIVRVNTG